VDEKEDLSERNYMESVEKEEMVKVMSIASSS